MFVFNKRKMENRSGVMNGSLKFFVAFLIAVGIAGCYKILSVNQVSTATVGSTITTTFNVEVAGNSYAGTRHGIVGVQIPNDWTVDSVSFAGTYSDSCTFLPADSADADTGGQVDYWTDTLEVHYPSASGMHWVVFQSDSPHTAKSTTDTIAVTIKMTVGQNEGDFGIGYFVSDTREDFTGDTTNYASSLDNPITVTAATGVNQVKSTLPNQYGISQNYPNPFNPTTVINFDLPVASNVVIDLYNILGMKVATITRSEYSAGSHHISFDASRLASGTYIYSMKASGRDGSKFVSSKKMILLK